MFIKPVVDSNFSLELSGLLSEAELQPRPDLPLCAGGVLLPIPVRVTG